MSPELASKLAEHGLLGLLLLITLGIIYRLYGELKVERDGRLADGQAASAQIVNLQNARLTDAQAYTTKLLEMNTQLHASTNTLAEVADRFLQLSPAERRPPHHG